MVPALVGAGAILLFQQAFQLDDDFSTIGDDVLGLEDEERQRLLQCVPSAFRQPVVAVGRCALLFGR